MRQALGFISRGSVAKASRRLIELIACLSILLLLPISLSPQAAAWTAGGFFLLLLISASSGGAHLRRGLSALGLSGAERGVYFLESLLDLVRRIGLALLGLVFFLVWAAIYMLVWAVDPTSCPADTASDCQAAFLGMDAHPRLGDFIYLSINLAFANPPPDLIPASALAHTASSLEIIAGVALVTIYARAFFGLGREDEDGEEE